MLYFYCIILHQMRNGHFGPLWTEWRKCAWNEILWHLTALCTVRALGQIFVFSLPTEPERFLIFDTWKGFGMKNLKYCFGMLWVCWTCRQIENHILCVYILGVPTPTTAWEHTGKAMKLYTVHIKSIGFIRERLFLQKVGVAAGF